MFAIFLLTLAGLTDSIYLTFEHFRKVIPPCTVNNFLPILSDCGKVLTSQYAVFYGIPLAVFGIIHYSILAILLILSLLKKNKLIRYLTILESLGGAFASLYFMYLQLIVIKSICIYCTMSAIISFVIIILVFNKFRKEKFEFHLLVYGYIYQYLLKPFYFLIPPEFIHNQMVRLGEIIAKTPIIYFMRMKLVYKDKSLGQKLFGIKFENPVGLAAGFDYEGSLTQTLPHLNFGFQTVGTVTNLPYEGNMPPRLGRLPKSKSLMVNKGFKNKGAKYIVNKLKSLDSFLIPVGISIGVSNSKQITSISKAIDDIVKSFKVFENANLKTAYYELNISCPNLVNTKTLSFYPPKNLETLLNKIDRLKIKKPIFIKMPIEKTNREFLSMLKVISEHKSIKGIIIGNLQKDKKDPAFDKSELKKFKVGYFSGKPCERRSNELIKLTYRKYGDRLLIIGCGGIFSAHDAYKKIRLGASLIQLITGMIYQGPQLISQINLELIDLIKKDGFKNIKEAIGYENN